MKPLIFAVTNDLTYDQRMIRICTSLSLAGYPVLLVGRKMPGSLPLAEMPFRQKRLRLFFRRGFLFYAEFNIRLFFFLLFRRMSLICAIDLDTIIPCYYISILKKVPRVYDAHELFCEMKEIVTRPHIHRFWKWTEKHFVPAFQQGYTVSPRIAEEFSRNYDRQYIVIRNLPVLTPLHIPDRTEKYIIYQGAVNEGRSFETLIPAMAQVQARLLICGDGNFMHQARRLVAANGLEKKVIFLGNQSPAVLTTYTLNAHAGVALLENTGLNNYFSLANRFFDYMHAGIPQVCVNFPLYADIIRDHPFALLIDDLSPDNVARNINLLLHDKLLYAQMQQACLAARESLNWQQEEKTLIHFYQQIQTGIDR